MKINILQIIILFLIIFHTDNNFAQTVTNNFIKSTTVLVPNITTTTQLNNLPNTSTRKQLSYFDGLGRPELSIIIQGSPNGYDIISSNIYDQLGRTDTQYMAYTANQNNGSYITTNVANDQIKQFYNNPSDASIQATTAPYSIKVYENSPLSRVLTQTFPGQAWQAGNNGHPQSFFYSNNTNADSIKLWSVTYFNGAINGSACNEFYNAGQLYKTTTTDENNSMVIEYKDKTGLVVCKKTQDGANSYATTYYIYDDYNNLAYVLPPNISTINGFSENDTNFNYYIYGYHYDNQRRLIEKKIPGKNGWDMMVYNKANQLVLNSNSQQRADGYWIFNKYDGLGRIIQIGKFIDNRSRVELQDYINTDMVYYERKNYSNKLGYTNTALPLITDTNLILVTNFYDNYDFLNNELLNAIGGASSFFNAPADVSIKANGAQGLLVFTKVQVLGSYINLGSGGISGINANSSTAQYLYSMNLYDRNGRVVKIVKTNYINGADIYDNSYNFVGELTTTKRTVYINNNFSSSNLVIQTNINYDRMGRKTGTKMIINNGSEVQTDSLEYNELGQIKTKRLHVNNDAGLEAINYAYNPRGWLTKAEGNYFKQKLYYDEIINNSTPQYNGNISVQTWGNNYLNQEKYYYDKLNRLTTYTNNSNNNETISYADKIGNIAKIIRAGSINETIIFSYIGNKIKRANNFEYFYNENGSVLNNGNIIISGYNELNLPNNISKAHASIFFTYNAKGEKVFKNEVGKEYRTYDDGLEFTRKNITEPYVLDIIKFEEGYIQNATNNFNFYYNLKDHIGNTRVSFMVNPNNVGNINQSIDYYAFGKVRIQGESAIKYLFNGNEYQTGLDVFDFNARTYDPTTGRFLQVDPNVEDGEQLGFNPYHFSFNNPIRFIDPDGRCPLCLTALAGAAIGAVVGGGIELATQLYNEGSVSNWSAVGGAAAQGAITGTVAGLTGGASLVTTALATASANVAGGVANRAIQGQETTLTNIATDATIGSILGVGGKFVGNGVSSGTNNLSNSAKGKLGEAITEIKYGVQGYKSAGNDVVKTGGETATGKEAVARFDHKMENIFTGKKITVESKFNKSGLTPNQNSVIKNGYKVTIDKTTSNELGNAAKTTSIGTGAGFDAQRNKKP